MSFPTDELSANSGNDSKVGKNPKVSDVKLLNPDVWEVVNPELSVLMLGNPDPSSEYSSSLKTENKEYFQCFSVSDPDPYHLVGSGSVSGNVDMDPGSAKN